MPAKKTKRQVCATRGCRKTAVEDGLCQTCLDSIIPEDKTQALTDAEAEYWGRLYAEVMSSKQSAQLYLYQQRELQRKYEEQNAALAQKRRDALANAEQLRGEYEKFTGELCDKYSVSRECAVIDVDGRVIREEKQ